MELLVIQAALVNEHNPSTEIITPFSDNNYVHFYVPSVLHHVMPQMGVHTHA